MHFCIQLSFSRTCLPNVLHPMMESIFMASYTSGINIDDMYGTNIDDINVPPPFVHIARRVYSLALWWISLFPGSLFRHQKCLIQPSSWNSQEEDSGRWGNKDKCQNTERWGHVEPLSWQEKKNCSMTTMHLFIHDSGEITHFGYLLFSELKQLVRLTHFGCSIFSGLALL